MPASALRAKLTPLGGFFAMAGDSLRAMFRRPFAVGEFLEQTVFIASVSFLPAIFVTIPFTVVVQFFINQLLMEIGATDLSGAGAGLVVIQELGPFCSVLVVAGAGATAVCADLGARKIREELDAMEVLGLDPIRALVLPRIIAVTVMTGLLDLLALVFGVIGGYLAAVLLGSSPAAFRDNFFANATTVDVMGSVLKTTIFGLVIAVVCCYKGLTAAGGASGVGRAVNQAVVISFAAIWSINFIFTTILLGLAPQIQVYR